MSGGGLPPSDVSSFTKLRVQGKESGNTRSKEGALEVEKSLSIFPDGG